MPLLCPVPPCENFNGYLPLFRVQAELVCACGGRLDGRARGGRGSASRTRATRARPGACAVSGASADVCGCAGAAAFEASRARAFPAREGRTYIYRLLAHAVPRKTSNK